MNQHDKQSYTAAAAPPSRDRVNLSFQMHFLAQVYQVKWFPGQKKMNTSRELELAATWDEPENQAELVPCPDPDQKQNSNFFLK